MALALLFFLIGLVVIIASAEYLNAGAMSLAAKLNISPIIIGLTVVAFGTSAPELFVSVTSALQQAPELAVGNIIGSNITNILLILGVAAIIAPLKLDTHTIKRQIPFAVFSAVVLLLMSNNQWLGQSNAITAVEGGILVALFICFLVYLVRLAKTRQHPPLPDLKEMAWNKSLVLIVIGLAGLFLGGQLLVKNATTLATIAGLSEALIGLTIVAIGTSLPELVTSVVAVRRKHDGIAIGNVIGSNVFNILWVLGITSVIQPLPISTALRFDMLIMLGATAVLLGLILLSRDYLLRRWHGITFLLLFGVYLGYIMYRG